MIFVFPTKGAWFFDIPAVVSRRAGRHIGSNRWSATKTAVRTGVRHRQTLRNQRKVAFSERPLIQRQSEIRWCVAWQSRGALSYSCFAKGS